MKLLIASALCVSLMGCVAQAPLPTSGDLVTANYGTTLDARVVAQGVPGLLNLRDPYSAIIKCDPARKGWMQHMNSPTEYGYIYACSVNAKNGYGAYSGQQVVGIFSSGVWLRLIPSDRNRWNFSF